MTATVERPPEAPQANGNAAGRINGQNGAAAYPPAAPTPPALAPAPPASPPARDVPWPDRSREDEPAVITSTVAGLFAAFGIIAVPLLGMLLGSRGVFGRSGAG